MNIASIAIFSKVYLKFLFGLIARIHLSFVVELFKEFVLSLELFIYDEC